MKEDSLFMRVRRLQPTAVLPARATKESAGLDLHADLSAPVVIAPREVVRIPTGIALSLPIGTAGFVFARSGLGFNHGVVPANGVGVIDSDYRGEILVALRNHSDTPYEVAHGDRVAQLVIMPVAAPYIEEVAQLDDTARGASGWGSSGR